jgi:hypothetical protein
LGLLSFPFPLFACKTLSDNGVKLFLRERLGRFRRGFIRLGINRSRSRRGFSNRRGVNR